MVRGSLQTLAIAITYYVAAKFALLLATPSGFAAPLWPPAGIAVAALLVFGYRLLPGILIGALCANLDAAYAGPMNPSLSSALVLAASIATGASLQAFLGAWMVRRWSVFPVALSSDDDVIRFLAYCGPVSCVVGATWGVSSLGLAGVTSPQEFAFSWWTWWVGDVIGVLIFAPLVLVCFARPRSIWRGRWISVAIPLTASLVAAIGIFFFARVQEQKQAQLEFQKQASYLTQQVEETIDHYLDVVSSVQSLYGSSDLVTRDEFHTFTRRALIRHVGIQALEWIPRVSQEDREAYETLARCDGCPTFSMTQKDAHGLLVPAAIRDEYFPVYYVAPLHGNEVVLGYDLGSDTERRAVLEKARDSGTPVATAPLRLVQEATDQMGILVVHPVYASNQVIETIAQRRQFLTGYVLGVFRVGDVVDASLHWTNWEGNLLTIRDLGEPSESPPLYEGAGGGDNTLSGSGSTRRLDRAHGVAWNTECDVAGRRWSLSIEPTVAYLASTRPWQAWMVLAGGLVFTSLLGTFLLMQSGRTTAVEEKVVARTAELSRANEDLEREVRERMQVEAALFTSRNELEQRVFERTAELNASRAQFQDLYDHAPDMFATVDAQTYRVVECNQTFLNETGFKKSEVVGYTICDLYCLESLDEVAIALEEFVQTGNVRDTELVLRRKDGSPIDVSWNASPIRDETGAIVRVRAIWRDITDRKRAEEKIRQQQTDLAHVSRLSSMGEMAAGLAHEINQPLTAIAAYAEGAAMRIANGQTDPDQLRGIVDRIASDAHRAGEVIRRLRRFVRKRQPVRGALDINHLVQDVVHFMASDALQDQVTVELNLADGLPLVRGDSVEIQQVILNLLRNGHDAMQDIDIAHRVLSVDTVQADRGVVEVIVRDAGPGVLVDNPEQVFEAFFSSKSDGLGMGLAISRTIVESNGGRIWVADPAGHAANRGAEIHFSMPTVEEETDDE